ncbi:MAG: hypothetical protein ACT4O5_03980 [Gammaproteobacteria bacterium]
MNWKVIVIGGLVFFVATWLIAPITGPLIHEGVLKEAYMATATFWRPELNEQPPNMAALMPYWITVGLIGSFITAGIYGIVRRALTGPGWMRGLKFGVGLTLLAIGTMAGLSGVFNLPAEIWAWWALEWTLMYLLGGVLLGWVAEKVAPTASTA